MFQFSAVFTYPENEVLRLPRSQALEVSPCGVAAILPASVLNVCVNSFLGLLLQMV